MKDLHLTSSNPHHVRVPPAPAERVELVRVPRTAPHLILELGGWNGGSFSCSVDESDIVLVCGWGGQCEPATLKAFDTHGYDQDHGNNYRWERTDYYVNLKSDVIERFSSLQAMARSKKVVVFALPENVTEAMIGRLRDFAGNIMVVRQQIKDQIDALQEYKAMEDVTAPIDFRKGVAAAHQHIQDLQAKLKALYAKDLEEVVNGI